MQDSDEVRSRSEWESDFWNRLTLSYDEVATVGRIMLAWGSAEASVVGAAVTMGGFDQSKAVKDFIARQSFERKLAFLETLAAEVTLHPEVLGTLAELSELYRKYKPARDAIAHGHALLDWEAITEGSEVRRGVYMPSHDRLVEATDLSRQLRAADFAANTASFIALALLFSRSEWGTKTIQNANLRPQKPEGI